MRVLRAPETTNTPPTPSPESRLRSMAQRRALQASTLSAEAGKRRGPITTATCRASRSRNHHPRAAKPVSRAHRRLCAAGKWPSVNADPHELSEGRLMSNPSRGTVASSRNAAPAASAASDRNRRFGPDGYVAGRRPRAAAGRSVDAHDPGPPLRAVSAARAALSGERGALRGESRVRERANTAPF